jgi:hypothetical protein
MVNKLYIQNSCKTKNIPSPQFLRLASLTSSPLNPLNSQLSRLPHNLQLLLIIPPRLEQLQAPIKPKRAQGLRRLVPAHGVLGAVFHARFQVPDGLGLAALPEAVGELVLEEGRGRHEGGGDGFQSGDRLVGGRGLAGEVFEGEEGAEAGGQGRGFGCEGVAEREDGGVAGGRGVED